MFSHPNRKVWRRTENLSTASLALKIQFASVSLTCQLSPILSISNHLCVTSNYFTSVLLQSSATLWESPTRPSSTGYWLRCWETLSVWTNTCLLSCTLELFISLHCTTVPSSSKWTYTHLWPKKFWLNWFFTLWRKLNLFSSDWKTLFAFPPHNCADTQVKVWMNKYSWTENDEGQIFIYNQEESVKPKNIVEKIDFESESQCPQSWVRLDIAVLSLLEKVFKVFKKMIKCSDS